MLQSEPAIDLVFQALSDPARRAILQRLSAGPATVSELARPFDMSLAAVVQHVQKLERCGLLTSTKRGRTRHCQLNTAALLQVEGWLSARRLQWESHFDRLGELLAAETDPS